MPAASRPGLPRSVAIAVGTAVVYFAAAELGLSLAFAAKQVSVVWPPTGLALAAVILFGPTATAPAIALAAFAANVIAHEPIATATGIAIGNTLEALVGAALLERREFRPSLDRLRDVLLLMVLAAGASTTVAATIGTTSLCVGGVHPWSAFGSLWWTWWIGDALGALVIAPAVLVWTRGRTVLRPPEPRLEAALFFLTTVGVGLAAFGVRQTTPLAGYTMHFAVIPLVVWGALRFGPRGTVVVSVLMSIVGIWSGARGGGPFPMLAPEQRLLVLQLFMAVVTSSGLLLGAAITERDHSRREALLGFEQLQVSEERLRLALEAGRMGVWDWTVPTGALRWSESLEAIHGLPPGSFAGRLEGFYSLVHPDDRAHVGDAIARALRAGYGEVEFRGLRANGTVGWMSAAGRVIYDAAGHPARMLGVTMEVTERRRLADELEARAQELALVDRRKDEFLAMLAHELRNPLAPLSTMVHLLREEGGTSERLIAIAERQVQQLVRLVDDLLDVSRITQGKIVLRKEVVAVADVVARALDTVRPSLEAAQLEVRVSLPTEPVRLDVDPARLTQVLANLFDNAAKYTPAGGTVWLTAELLGDDLTLRVRDTGAGIAPDLLPSVFDLFVQGDRSLDRSRGGLGIGLTIVKRLVELHGGRIEARSSGPGQGSEFIIHLPARAPVFGETAAPRPVPPTGASTGLRVLVVEDNRDAAETLAMVVELWGHEVRVTYDAMAALDAVEEWHPHVVLSDIGLPGMDGYELARRLRSRPGLGGAVLVALSGYGRDEDKRAALAAGFDHHVLKPPDLDTLSGLLGRVASSPGARPGASRTVH
jgi:two-component system CheB/CheR fusion protein